MEFLSILMDIHIHLNPKPVPCHFHRDQPSPSPPSCYRARIGPPLWGRNNKIIPTLTIIFPTSASSAVPSSPTLQISSVLTHLFQISHPSGPPHPPPKRKKLPSGDTDRLSTLDQCLRTLVTNTSRLGLRLSDFETGQRTNFSITTSAAFTSLSAM